MIIMIVRSEFVSVTTEGLGGRGGRGQSKLDASFFEEGSGGGKLTMIPMAKIDT